MFDEEKDRDTTRVRKQAGNVKKTMKKYVRDYFFDENVPSDSDISSYHSGSEKQSQAKPETFSKKGFSVLLKARRKIDQLAKANHLESSNSSSHPIQENNAMRKFSIADSTGYAYQEPQQESLFSRYEQSVGDVHQYGTSEDLSMSFIEAMLRDCQRNMSTEELTITAALGTMASPSVFENLLVEYLINLPSSLEEFYKIMGELYVTEILKIRTDIKNPLQLMKELLLGRKQSNVFDVSSQNFINAMLEEAMQGHNSLMIEPSQTHAVPSEVEDIN
mmetsp:Transcript_19074/g.21962  ORF Transcript_19074/g.21962 Transcript_19074/m.21962 type:complete len:276 (+) Transcript_19074:550-1377(+)